MKMGKVLTAVTVSILGVGIIFFGFTGCSEIAKSTPNMESFIEEAKSVIDDIEDIEVREEVSVEKVAEPEKEGNSTVYGSKQIVKPDSTNIVGEEIQEETQSVKTDSKEKPKSGKTDSKRDEIAAQTNNETTPSSQTQKVAEQPVQPQVQPSIPEPQSAPAVQIQAPKGHYEERWVVDSPERVIEEPVSTQESRTICNGCGADITSSLDAHIAEHFAAEGVAPAITKIM